MLLSLCDLSFVKARYCATPLGKAEDSSMTVLGQQEEEGNSLTRHDVIDVDNDREVHCFPRIVVGATFHRDMGVDPRRSLAR
ncbi:hypothetical protein ZEAMMB73_Zm00001d049150 [Zea mays]|uniref:Uncharacterized protein n=1 Tax=Zea mays TaxID=4577 RepID=A0A1D6PSN5_MAIZE|nr:hypothetical protein ZEAMMB73_Zm00001d049150 [Zea mays]